MNVVDKPFKLADHPFSQRILTTVGIVTTAVLALLFCWYVAEVLLLIFAGILLAVLLHGSAKLLSVYTPIPEPWARLLSVILLFLLLGGSLWLLGPPFVNGIDELTQRLPGALSRLQEFLQRHDTVAKLFDNFQQNVTSTLLTSGLVSRLGGWFSNALGLLTGLLIILVTGLYLISEPRLYLNGALRLLPVSRRERARSVLETMGHSLHWWFMGRFSSMLIVGIMTYAGLLWLDVPAALTLAMLAGLLSFIPNLGPILSVVPALLVGLMQGFLTAVYIAVLYLGIQTVESYFITPLIQRSAVALPPAFLLLVQLAMGVLFGLLGLLLATPLAVVLLIATQKLYIEDVLGDRL